MRVGKLYDLLAPVYGRFVPGLYKRATRRAAERLSAGAPASILEVGVGPGHILAEMGRRNPNAHAVGLDISRGMLRQSSHALNKGGVEASLVCADAVKMPFGNGVFDGVVASFLLDLFQPEKIPDALREMARVLAPGGRIVVASLQFSSPVLKQFWMLAYRIEPHLVGHVRPVDFSQYVVDSGLRVLREEEIPEAAGTRLLTLVKVMG